MVIKVMDAGDVKEWTEICDMMLAVCNRFESAPKYLDEGESLDNYEVMKESITNVKIALRGAEKEGLYPAYIPTDAF